MDLSRGSIVRAALLDDDSAVAKSTGVSLGCTRDEEGGAMANPRVPGVVLVEDDASLAQALTRNLELAGIAVAAYRSGESLLQEGLCGDPLCLIIDIHLPGIDAFALLDRLAASGPVSPAILITAFDSQGAREQASRAGVAAYLRKPFPSRALLQAIETIRAARNAA